MLRMPAAVRSLALPLLASAVLGTLHLAQVQRPTRFQLPTLTSDEPDYAPGSVATLTGTGFWPNEAVTLLVIRLDATPPPGDPHHEPWVALANSRGRFVTTWDVCECDGALLLAVADGVSSGLHSETLFTDNHVDGTGVVTSVSPVGGSCVDFTPAVGNGPDNWEVQEGGTYVMTIDGVTECTGDTITVLIQNSNTGNFCFNATGGGGTYVGTFMMPDPACFTSPVSYKCGANAPCSHPDSFAAAGPTSGDGGVHLRASTFDGNCNRTGTDEDCDEACVTTTLDFETDGCGDPTLMNHGLDLSSPGPECAFTCPTVTGGPGNGSGNAGLAIFDSETVGGSQDPDLQAAPPGQGNLLILQNDNTATTLLKTGVNGPDTYDHPNDDPDGGSITFDFCSPVEILSTELIDIDPPAPDQNSSIVLMDVNGFTRTYLVVGGWTGDGQVGTLDLNGGDQIGPGGGIATVSTDAGYDGTQIVQMLVTFGSSGAIDNLTWCE